MDKAGLGVKSCISELPSQSKGRYHKITVDHSACFSDVLRTARMNPLTVAVVPRQAGKKPIKTFGLPGPGTKTEPCAVESVTLAAGGIIYSPFASVFELPESAGGVSPP